MKIYEYRTICPCSYSKYQIGNIYMISKRSEEETKQVAGEGIEVVANEPFNDGKHFGNYTYKIMHVKSRIPSFIRWALPDSYCHCHEKSWNAYPNFHTEYAVPGMGDNFVMIVDSYHIPYKHGDRIPENALKLTEEELQERKIVYLDILNGEPKPDQEHDISNWTCQSLNVHQPLRTYLKDPLATGNDSEPPLWTHNYPGDMTMAIKVVKIQFKWRGLQTLVEKFATTMFYYNLFQQNHRSMLLWAEAWSQMTLEEVSEFESRIYDQNNETDFVRDGTVPLTNTNDHIHNKLMSSSHSFEQETDTQVLA